MVKNGTPASPAMARAEEGVLAGARRPDQKSALGNLATQPRKLAGILKILDDFLEFFSRLVDAGDIGESHSPLLLGQHARPTFAETHRAGTGVLLHLPHDKETDAQNEQERQRIVKHVEPNARSLFAFHLNRDALGDELVGDVRVARSDRVEGLPTGKLASDLRIAAGVGRNHDRADITVVHLANEIRISDRRARRVARSALDHGYEKEERNDDAEPDE